MGIASEHGPVKLIIGLIGQEQLLDKAKITLAGKFGSIDFESPVFDFTFTDYYTAEMGEHLKRQFISFRKAIAPAALAGIKRFCNRLEKRLFSRAGKRLVNIDPGYLTLAKLVLATTKDQQHRLSIGNGIFAEVTLRFRDKTFQKWDWTYPDYCAAESIAVFNHIRTTLVKERPPRHAR
jgi:hypothetical protein